MSNELCPDVVLQSIFEISSLKAFELIEIASYSQELYNIIFTKQVLKSKQLLTLSAKNNCLPIFKILYDDNPYIHIVNEYENLKTTYFHIACRCGAKNIVKFLLYRKVDPNISCNHVNSPLSIASINKRFDICKLLVEAGATINPVNDRQFTPLQNACMTNNEKLIRFFVKHGADPNLYYNSHNDLLGLLCLHNNLKMVQFLIKNGANYRNHNLLLHCFDKLDLFKYLLTLDLPIDFLEWTLVKCTRWKDVVYAKLLLKKKVNVNCGIPIFDTPLHNAVLDSNFQMCELLVKAKAQPNFVFGSHSPLHLALSFDRYYIVKLLLRHGGDPNICTPDGFSCYDLCEDFDSEYGYNKKRRIE